MAKILIAGIGYIGQSLAEKLKQFGHEVIGICRTPKSLDYQVIAKEILSLSEEDLPQGIDYVFYMLSAGQRTPEAYQKAYVDGVEHLLHCLQGQTIQRFFYISSTGVYPANMDGIVTEESAFTSDSFTSKALLEGEQKVCDSHIPHTILRLGGIYGPGRTSLLRRVKAGEASLSKDPIYTNRIHQQDAVGILIHLLNLAHPESLYVGVDCKCVTYNEVITWIAKKYHVTLSQGDNPARPSKQISNQKILASGYRYIYPSYQEGYEALMAQK